MHASPGQSYEMTGVVVPGSIHHHGSLLDFRVEDRDNSKVSIPVTLPRRGSRPVPDGREIDRHRKRRRTERSWPTATA